MKIKCLKMLIRRSLSNSAEFKYLENTLDQIFVNPYLDNPQHDYPKFVNKISFLLYRQLSDHYLKISENKDFLKIIDNHKEFLKENKYNLTVNDNFIKINSLTDTHKTEIVFEHLYFSYNKDLSEIESLTLYEKIEKRKNSNYISKNSSDDLDFYIGGKMVNNQAKPFVLSNYNSEDKIINLINPFSLKKVNNNILKFKLHLSSLENNLHLLTIDGFIVD